MVGRGGGGACRELGAGRLRERETLQCINLPGTQLILNPTLVFEAGHQVEGSAKAA